MEERIEGFKPYFRWLAPYTEVITAQGFTPQSFQTLF